MNKQDDDIKKLNAEIAKRIKTLRKTKGLSLENVAQKTGFAQSYLSQIENLKREPPISTLSRIARALGEDIIYLITGEVNHRKAENFTIVRPDERKIAVRHSGKGGYTYQSITYKKKDRRMDGYIFSAEFEFPDEPTQHEGQELAYMLEGSKEMVYDGKKFIINKGDCIYYDSNRPHYSRSIGDKRAEFLVVFLPDLEK
jgi:transcriptional regulator with XRE-family HTH domain